MRKVWWQGHEASLLYCISCLETENGQHLEPHNKTSRSTLCGTSSSKASSPSKDSILFPNNTTSWEPNGQLHEPMRNVLYSNHNTLSSLEHFLGSFIHFWRAGALELTRPLKGWTGLPASLLMLWCVLSGTLNGTALSAKLWQLVHELCCRNATKRLLRVITCVPHASR